MKYNGADIDKVMYNGQEVSTALLNGYPLHLKSAVTNGLSLYLDGKDFKNSPQTTTLKDRSGLGSDGACTGFAYTVASGSDGAGGIVFAGDNDIIQIPNSNMDKIFGSSTSNFTIEIYAKVHVYNATGVSTPLIDNWDFPNNKGFTVRGWNSEIQFTMANGINYASVNIPRPAVDTPFHYVVTYDGDYSRAYLNGASLINNQISGRVMIPSTLAIRIGYNAVNGGYLNGTIYVARIYKRALTANEVLKNYNGINL